MKTKSGYEIRDGHVLVPVAEFAGFPAQPPAEVVTRVCAGENALKVVREWRGLTQAQLADRCGVSDKSRVSDIERGKSAGSLKFWRAAAAALRVPVSFFLESLGWD